MARGSQKTEDSPEEIAEKEMRYNARLQQAQERKNLVNARMLMRNQALQAGIPKAYLPDASQIKNMDDASWNGVSERLGRLGFHGLDEKGQRLPAPAQRPLVLPNRTDAPRNFAGRTPLSTVGPLESGARQQPAAAPATPVVAPPLNQFSTTPADARAIAARYGTGDAKTTFSKAPDRVPFIAGANGVDVGPAIAAQVSQNDPTLKKTPTNIPVPPAALPTLQTDPFRDITPDSRAPKVLNTDLTKTGPVFPVEQQPPVPPSAAETLGRQVRGTAINTLNAVADVAITKPLGVAASVGRTAAGFADKYVRQPISYAGNVAGDFVRGATTPLGVTNSSATQFKAPTKESPVPVTPTSPAMAIDRSETSINRFGLSEDELTKRKNAFAGF